MTFLRDVWIDLVDKKLWPLAVALVIALVAAPMVLSKGAGNAPATAAVSAAGGPDLPEALVSRATEQHIGLFTGKARDPFRPQGYAAAATGSSTATAASQPAAPGTTSAPAGGTAGSGGSSGSGGGSTTTPASGTTGSGVDHSPGVKELEVVVRFGVFGSQLGESSFAPLTALPPAAHPFLIYLGRARDGKTAVFSIAGNVVATGDGECRPSKSLCKFLNLKPGDVESLVVTTATGKSVEYELELLKYVKK